MGFFSSLVGGVVGFLIGGPVGAVIGAGIGATKVGEKAVNAVLDFVTKPFMPDMPDMGNLAEAERQRGVLIQREGSTEQIPVVYGYRKVAGVVTFAETGATNNKYLYVAYVFCEGLVEGLREVYIDDWLLPTNMVGNLNAGQLVNIDSDKYAGRVQMRWSPGVYFSDARNSPAGTILKGDIFADAPSFTTNMVYNGLATLFVRYEWKEIKTQEDADNNPFGGNIPEVQVSLLGKRIASLTVDTTETQEYDSNPVRYSTNPAEILLDYLRNPRYGKGLSNDDIDWASWKIAARKCNTTVTYVASGIQGPILTLNAVVDTGQTLLSNVKMMLKNFRAYMPYVQGKYKLRIEDAGNPTDILSGAATIVQTFTKDDIVSDITYTGIEKSSKYTSFAVTYVDPDQKWSNQTVVYPETEQERQTYITQDGGRENPGSDTYGGITNYAIAKDMARLAFNKQRRQETCVLTVTSKALELEPGDNIRIQSNILNFGTDPWRVISIKINNDMTVDLGCVRNPDDIYPYVRVGEEDIVLPTYIPKGSIIYFPSSYNTPPVGLVPPTNAVFPPADDGNTTNPPPTDPNGNDGGGVGGEDNTGGDSGGNDDNNVPTPPPPPAPFAAVLVLKSSRAVAIGNGQYNFNIVFTQPTDGLYANSKVWWRYNPYAPWQEVALDTVPGAGGDIPWTFTAGFGHYEYYVRSFASDGRGSINVLRGQVSFPQNVAELNPTLIGIATARTEQVQEGWSVPAPLAEAAPRYNDDINSIGIFTKLVSGTHTNPRRLRVTMNQNTNTYSNTPNLLISGVRIYYKYSTDIYYSYEDFLFSSVANYAPGVQVSFDLAGDFGVPGGGFDAYNFLVRLLYSDGTAAEKQMGPVTARVQSLVGLENFVVAGTIGTTITAGFNTAASLRSDIIPQGFTLLTVDQDPNRAFASGSDIIPQIDTIIADYTLNKIAFTFSKPTSNKFRGLRIRFREVIPGTNPEFTTIDVGPTIDPVTGKIRYQIDGQGFKLNNYFDWVITARYSNAGVDTECTNSLECRARVPQYSGYTYTNLMNTLFNFTEDTTANAVNDLRVSFPALPTPVAFNWYKHMDRAKSNTGFGPSQGNSLADASDVYYNSANGNYYLNRYFKLKFQMPNDTFDGVVIYRRVFDTYGAANSTGAGSAKYFGLGAWEKTYAARTSLVKGADGLYTLNVRGPLDIWLFDPYYELQTGKTLWLNKWGPSPGKYPSQTAQSFATDVYPYYGTGNADFRSGTITRWAEFIFVIKDVGVESSKGLYVKDFFAAVDGTAWRTDVDGFLTGNIEKNVVVTVSDYNTFSAGYKRNINESVYNDFGTGNIALAQLATGPASPTYGRSTPSGASLNVYLLPPTSGDTVF